MLRHLHRHQRARDEIDAGAAVLGRDVEAPEAHLAHLCGEALEVLDGELAGVGVELGLQRHDLLAHEPAHGGHDLALLFGGVEVHWWRPGSGEMAVVSREWSVVSGEWSLVCIFGHSLHHSRLTISHSGLSRPSRGGGSAWFTTGSDP